MYSSSFSINSQHVGISPDRSGLRHQLPTRPRFYRDRRDFRCAPTSPINHQPSTIVYLTYPIQCYHLMADDAHEKPAPNAARMMISPSSNLPLDRASDIAMGMDAAVVFP